MNFKKYFRGAIAKCSSAPKFKGLHGKVRTKLLHEKVWHNHEAYQTFDVLAWMHAWLYSARNW